MNEAVTRQKECAHAFPQQLPSDLNDGGSCLIKDRQTRVIFWGIRRYKPAPVTWAVIRLMIK